MQGALVRRGLHGVPSHKLADCNMHCLSSGVPAAQHMRVTHNIDRDVLPAPPTGDGQPQAIMAGHVHGKKAPLPAP